MPHYVGQFIEITDVPGERHYVALVDPEMGLDAPPGVEFEMDNEGMDSVYFAFRDYRLSCHGLQRVDVVAEDIQPGDILFEFGTAVTTSKHLIGSAVEGETEVNDFVLIFCGPTGDISLRLPFGHKLSVNRKVDL